MTVPEPPASEPDDEGPSPLGTALDLVALAGMILSLRVILKAGGIPKLVRRVGWCWRHGWCEDGGCELCLERLAPLRDPELDRQRADELEAESIAKWGADASERA